MRSNTLHQSPASFPGGTPQEPEYAMESLAVAESVRIVLARVAAASCSSPHYARPKMPNSPESLLEAASSLGLASHPLTSAQTSEFVALYSAFLAPCVYYNVWAANDVLFAGFLACVGEYLFDTEPEAFPAPDACGADEFAAAVKLALTTIGLSLVRGVRGNTHCATLPSAPFGTPDTLLYSDDTSFPGDTSPSRT